MLAKLWTEAWSHLLMEVSQQELGWLASPRQHISLLSARRAAMIVSRVRVIASLFVTLTPLWILVDALLLPLNLWLGLAAVRMVATAGFAYVVIRFRTPRGTNDVYRGLASLIAIPVLFFLCTQFYLAQFQVSGLPAAILAGYGFLPYLMMAGLSIFPLTALEGGLCMLGVLAVQLLAAASNLSRYDSHHFAIDFWLLTLIGGISVFAGLSQLAFVIALVREAIRDSLTSAFSRQSGEELLSLQFIISRRTDTPLSVVFADLDRFKDVNDQFGHDAGDRVLMIAAKRIRAHLRTGDILARWGGEEFVIIMPNTRVDQALSALDRVRANGLGLRPDGASITASMGIAERSEEGAPDWQALVEKADTRMYAAKAAGRNRVVFQDR